MYDSWTLSAIILFKSVLHVFCSLVFSAHNSSATFSLEFDQKCSFFALENSEHVLVGHLRNVFWTKSNVERVTGHRGEKPPEVIDFPDFLRSPSHGD